ncbi:MAG: protein kinase [Proteobacteria bacterium]|nr:protein kinase [Pseudomonadota bacterium]
MGVVYAAHDSGRNMRVALKILRNATARGLYQFKREFRTLSDISHPNIVALYELICRGDEWAFTMELIEGCDFIGYVRGGRNLDVPCYTASQSRHHHIDTATSTPATQTSWSIRSMEREGDRPGFSCGAGLPNPPQVRPDIAQLVDIDRLRGGLTQLAHALQFLHNSGIVHRDLKPSNVRVTREGRVVVMDFGIAAELHLPVDPETAAMPCGTPAFMSPEQIAGAPPAAAVDWYSLGVMLYLALTGHRPYEGKQAEILSAKHNVNPLPPSCFARHIPADLERLCTDLLTRDAGRRMTGPQLLDVVAHFAAIKIAPAARSDHYTESTADNGRVAFVGRVRELTALESIVSAVEGGLTKWVVVHGPSGIGKTSMLDRFLDELGPSATLDRVFTGYCQASESLAYKAFDGVIDDLSRCLLTIPEDELRSLLPCDVGALTRLFPTLSRVPGCDPGKAFQGRDPIELRRQAVESLRELLGRLACTRPVIIRIEDLHWADCESFELLAGLLAAPPPAGLLVLATMHSPESGAYCAKRDELFTRLDEAGVYCQIELGPLLPEEERELMKRVCRRHRVQLPTGERLWREVAGHPMLLTELTRFVREAPDQLADMGQLALIDVIWRRIEYLPRVARILLEVVAVAGEPIPLAVLAEAANLADNARERALAVLRIARLVQRISYSDEEQPSQGSWQEPSQEQWIDVYHSKVSEAMISHLPARRIRSLHAQLARCLELWQGASVASLAHHWLGAGDQRRAVPHLLMAAGAAADQLAIDRAAELYRTALDHMTNGPGDVELETWRCRAMIGLAACLRIQERNDEALTLLDRAEVLGTKHGLYAELAQLHYWRGNLLFPTGDAKGCLSEHRKATLFASKSDSLEWKALALGGMGDAYIADGRMLSAYRHLTQCIDLCHQHGFSSIEVANLPVMGWSCFYQNHVREAARYCRDGIRGAIRTGHRRAEAMARAWLGMILTEMGQLKPARAEVERAMLLATELGMQRFLVGMGQILVKNRFLAGQISEARDLMADLNELAGPGPDHFTGPWRFSNLALLTNDPEARYRALAAGQELLEWGAAGFNALFFCRDAVDLAFGLGNADETERYTDLLERFTSPEPTPWSRFMVRRGRALATALRRPDDQRNRLVLLTLHDRARRMNLHIAARALADAQLGLA